jgi:pyruvate/2-oxoglutarate dehydrogenase complex dihydrolipoamide acyltransferase (E2) component
MRRVPVVDEDGGVSAGHQIVLSLTFDHAFIDGAPAAAFLQEVAAALADRA